MQKDYLIYTIIKWLNQNTLLNVKAMIFGVMIANYGYSMIIWSSIPISLCKFILQKIIDIDGKDVGGYLGKADVSIIASFENNLMDFFSTASKFFRKEILDNVPDSYFIGDAGNFSGMVLTMSYGEVFYSEKVMVAYRIGVPGSSNNRFN